MMTRIIKTLEEDGALTFPPASDRDIRYATSILTTNNIPPIPSHYVEMLRKTDGLVWNGVELYGASSNERSSKSYTLPSVVDINMGFMGDDRMRGMLILGRASEEIFVYNSRQNNYQVLDRHDMSVTGNFPTFAEAIYLFIEDLF